MSSLVTRLGEIAEALETREDTARSAASEVEGEVLGKDLNALADGLAQDRERLAAVAERLRRDAEGRAEELTAGHGDQSDPDSDLGL